MKIAFLINSLAVSGGAQRMTVLLAGGLARRGLKVEIITVAGGAGGASFFKLDPRVKILSLGGTEGEGFYRTWWRNVRRLRGLLRRGAYDCVVDVCTLWSLVSVPAALGLGIRTVGWEHMNAGEISSGFLGPLGRRVAAWLHHRVVVLTDDDKKTYIRNYRARRVETIPNPVTIAADEPSPLTEKRFLAMGRFSDVKGFDMLLDAWELTRCRHKGWSLRIVGSGPLERSYRARVAKLGLTDSVEIVAPVRDVERMYRESSVYVMSSRNEGMPLVLIEAMAMGLPIVSFDCEAGPRNVVVDGVTGLLVPPLDVARLAAAMDVLAARRSLRRRMSAAALERSRLFAPDAVFDRWMALLKKGQEFSRLVVVDSFSPASHHEQFNASIAMMLVSIFPRFVYLVGDGQWGSMLMKWRQSGFSPWGVDRRRLGVASSRNRRGDVVMRHLGSALHNVVALAGSRRGDLLIFNYNNPAALLPLKLLNAVMRRAVVIITHGELEYIALAPSTPWSGTTRQVGKVFARLLKMRTGSRNIRYMVLGESIKRNLAALKAVDIRQVIAIDHPYIFNPAAARDNNTAPYPAGISTVGVKNFPANFDTDAWIVRQAVALPHLTFLVIGTWSRINTPGGPRVENIENHTGPTQKHRAEYERILSRMEAMIYLYPDDEYRLKASGAIFDCLERGIPAIAVRNDYFDHLLALHGPLGYLYPSLESLTHDLASVTTRDHSSVRRNIAAARTHHSPENLTRELQHALDEAFAR